MAISDWGTVVQRRTSKEPVDKGGWSAFCSAFSSFDFASPAVHPLLRANGGSGYFGWPTIPGLETLHARWFEAPDDTARKAIASDIQRVALEEVAYVPLGSYISYTALRSSLTDRVKGFAIFWNLRRHRRDTTVGGRLLPVRLRVLLRLGHWGHDDDLRLELPGRGDGVGDSRGLRGGFGAHGPELLAGLPGQPIHPHTEILDLAAG